MEHKSYDSVVTDHKDVEVVNVIAGKLIKNSSMRMRLITSI